MMNEPVMELTQENEELSVNEETLVQEIDEATRPEKMVKIETLSKEDQKKVLFVGKDARFAELEKKLDSDSENLIVDGKILATIDGKSAAGFSVESLKNWLSMSKMVSEQRHAQMFAQRANRRPGKLRIHQVALSAPAKRKARQKASRASRRANR